jgi:ABC-type Fe3+ transport system permease subunit
VYFIQLTFISGGFWILDLAHKLNKMIGKCQNNRKNKKAFTEKAFVDTFAFDLGLWCSYTLTTYAIALMFCVFVPWVTLFAVPFFFLKYSVDKYNLTFNYRPNFKGSGLIVKRIAPLTIFIILIVQTLNFAIISARLKTKTVDAGFLSSLTETLDTLAEQQNSLSGDLLV